ncbi:Uma2 family endonuclease [Kitasatospora sp. NPDC059722]|uniref:Uma2 family endonuclease n=1 Tax=unclassified Kitasatospora TaxID=2633591 RepID=UPI00364B49A6
MHKEMDLDDMPEWLRPPATGHTADDLDRLENLPPHTELLFGSLIFSSRQTMFHSRTISTLERQLEDQAPEGWEVWGRMGLKLDARNRPEPDVMVVDARADTGPDQTFCLAQDVLLVVEVVEEESAERDRELKPRKYANAGIRYFWRVEYEQDRPVVHTYELDLASSDYVPTGVFPDRLVTRQPFPLDLTLTRPNRGREVSAPGTPE